MLVTPNEGITLRSGMVREKENAMLGMYKDLMRGWTDCSSVGHYAILYCGVFYVMAQDREGEHFDSDVMYEVDEREEDQFLDDLAQDEWDRLRKGRRTEMLGRVWDSLTMDEVQKDIMDAVSKV